MKIGAQTAIAVIGAGFSGLMCAIHLLMKSGEDGPRIYLIEQRSAFGAGAAYSTDDPAHLLNTRAANMSVFADRPFHFLDWLLRRDETFDGNGASFVSRRTYRAYLQSLLRDAACSARALGRLYLVPDEAVALKPAGGRFEVHLKVGKVLAVDSAVIATGNPPPHVPDVPCADFFDSPLYIDDPWNGRAFDAVAARDTVVILGTGLTMIDVVLSLRLRGHEGPVMALSRRGLIPRRHELAARPLARAAPLVAPRLSLALKQVRTAVAEAQGAGGAWQDVVDTLRPFTADYWHGLPLDAKRRFLRHLRPWWDVHRHRLAPQVADRIGELIRDGHLVICRGKLVRIALDDSAEALRARVSWRPAGETTVYRTTADRVVNGMGIGYDPARSKSPLMQSLLASGLAKPDGLGLGLDVDGRGRLIASGDAPSEHLFALGPPTRGRFWDANAVPDLRLQAEIVASAALQAARRPSGSESHEQYQ